MRILFGILVWPKKLYNDIEYVQKRCLKLLFPALSYT